MPVSQAAHEPSFGVANNYILNFEHFWLLTIHRRNRFPGPMDSSMGQNVSSLVVLGVLFQLLPKWKSCLSPKDFPNFTMCLPSPCCHIQGSEPWYWQYWILLISHFSFLNASIWLAMRSHRPYLKQLVVNTWALFSEVGSRSLHHVGKKKKLQKG